MKTPKPFTEVILDSLNMGQISENILHQDINNKVHSVFKDPQEEKYKKTLHVSHSNETAT